VAVVRSFAWVRIGSRFLARENAAKVCDRSPRLK
jgi:hypothetical protein